MTAEMVDALPMRRMTNAELRCITEDLGLSLQHLTQRWQLAHPTAGVCESRVRNWMKGQVEVPDWVAADVVEMSEDTDAKLDMLVDMLESEPDDNRQVPTYRSESEYRHELGEDAPYSANWHRRLCARAAAEVDHVTITFAVPPINAWQRKEGNDHG